jgi:transposase
MLAIGTFEEEKRIRLWFACIATAKSQKGDTKSLDRQKSGGSTTKILALVDALGNLVGLRLIPGQRGETTGVTALLEWLNLSALLGDKAYDADWLRHDLKQRGVEAVIPPRAKRLNPANYDAEKYKWRHLIENFFQKLKEFRDIAMRSYKTDSSFSAMIYIAALVIRTR